MAASNDRRVVSGVAVMLGDDTTVGWKSIIRITCVTTANCESKYVAIYHASKEAIFTRATPVFLHFELSDMRVKALVG